MPRAWGPTGPSDLITIRDKTTTVLFPAPSSKVRPDTKTYNSCPGPIDLSNREQFRAHGLYLRPGKSSVHTLYLVHHGSRESIEIFELDGRAKPPVLTWTGCAVAPDRVWLNSVVGLPDGGFVTTNFSPIGQAPDLRAKILAGTNNGELWEWHTATGWQIVPGSSLPGPNGLEISRDGRWLYVGAWGSESVVRLSRGQTPVRKDSVPVGFHVDNVRWAPDGSLLAAGQGGTAPSQASHVARVNIDDDDIPGARSLPVQRHVQHGHGGDRGWTRASGSGPIAATGSRSSRRHRSHRDRACHAWRKPRSVLVTLGKTGARPQS